jgi:hypothetical protein
MLPASCSKPAHLLTPQDNQEYTYEDPYKHCSLSGQVYFPEKECTSGERYQHAASSENCQDGYQGIFKRKGVEI